VAEPSSPSTSTTSTLRLLLSASSAPTPTVRTCVSSHAPTPGKPGTNNSGWKSTEGYSSTAGSTAIWDFPAGSSSLLKTDPRPASCESMSHSAQLAIHLDRNVNDGLVLDRQTQVTPIWGQGEVDTGGFARLLAESLEVDEGGLLGWDVMAHDLTPSAQLGRNGEFYAAPRIDNLASCHAALEALTSTRESSVGATIPIIVLFDHEEIGSDSSTGAGSPLLGNVLERLMMSIGGDRDQYLQAIARSWCVSADGSHAAHPNYLDRHDPDHHVHLNAGPAVKMNANVRYASDAETVAFFRSICASAEVPMQEYVHRTNLACGSTIGPLTAANLGIRVVDVGSAQLSMHSAREMGGIHDPGHLTRAMTAFLSGVS
jgi:aspartyl aminopeptidase